MVKVKKTVSIENATEKILKKISKEEKRTESAVIDIAVQEYAARKKAS